MNIDEIRKLNKHIDIKNITDIKFKQYGNIICGYDFTSVISYAQENIEIPSDGTTYVASIKEIEAASIFEMVRDEFYGEMPIEAGYCAGKNSTLNGLEYHKGSEINIAVTDCVLLVGKLQDVQSNKYDSKGVEAFFLPEGTAVEIYSTTLHFAPCSVSTEGFNVIVILPAGTNLPIKSKGKRIGEGELLFMRNKWLLVHPSRKILVEKGACPGILGENIKVYIE